MEPRQQKVKNMLKNVVLLVLFVSMLVLICLTWLSDLSMENVPADSLVARVYQRLTYGAGGFELRTGSDPAAEPTRIAVSGTDGLVGAQYHAGSVSALYMALSEPMGQAFARELSFSACSEEEFAEALGGEVLYFGYEGYLPLALLSGWMGHANESMIKTDLLLLTDSGELYIHNESGYHRARADADAAAWQDKIHEMSASECTFAAQYGEGMFENVRPDTLILKNETMAAEQLAVRYPGFLDSQSGSDLTALLEAFQYDPYVRGYPEDKGETWVYAETYSTLHVSTNGEIEFRASAMEGGLEVYTAAETAQDETLRLQADFAYTLLCAAQGSISDNSQAMLFDVSEGEDDVRVLTFVQFVGGVPVQTAEDQPFARFEFQRNQLMAAQFHLRSFEPAGTQSAVLPSAQAAAAAPAGGLRPSLVYSSADGEHFTAQRCYQK